MKKILKVSKITAMVLILLILNIALNFIQIVILFQPKYLEWKALSLLYEEERSYTFDVRNFDHVYVSVYSIGNATISIEFKMGETQTYYDAWTLTFSSHEQIYEVAGSTLIITVKPQGKPVISIVVYAT